MRRGTTKRNFSVNDADMEKLVNGDAETIEKYRAKLGKKAALSNKRIEIANRTKKKEPPCIYDYLQPPKTFEEVSFTTEEVEQKFVRINDYIFWNEDKFYHNIGWNGDLRYFRLVEIKKNKEGDLDKFLKRLVNKIKKNNAKQLSNNSESEVIPCLK